MSQNAAEFKKQKIVETLSEMHKILIKYKDANIYERAKYLLSSKNALSSLDFKLSQQIHDLTTLITILNGLLTSQLQPLIEKVLEKQDEASEKEEKRWAAVDAGNTSRLSGHSKAHENVPEKAHRVQTALDSVLQNKPSDSTMSQQNDNLVQNDIETRLGQAGLSTTDISALIKMIGQQREKLTHPEDIDATSGAGGKQRLNGPTGWIMTVDNHNSGTMVVSPASNQMTLLNRFKYVQSSRRPTSSLCESGPSISRVLGFLTVSNPRVSRLRPGSRPNTCQDLWRRGGRVQKTLP